VKYPIFTGSGVAIITPFFDGTVDIPCLKRLLDFHLDSGTDAIIVCGTTGEASTMSYRERMRTIECCVEYINKRIPVIAGTGSNSTENTRILSKDAQQAGADALLLVTPYYNKTTQAGLVQHFSYVADRVDIPLIVYNVPGRTGIGCTAETYQILSKHPNINGIKEASGDIALFTRTRAMCGDDMNIWSGNDDNTIPMMAMGCKGVISVASNIFPRQIADLCQLCFEGKFDAASEIYYKYYKVFDYMFIEVNPIPVKTAMNLMGYDVGIFRLPLVDMAPANLEKLKAALLEVGAKLK